MMSLPVWLPDPMFLLWGGVFVRGSLSGGGLCPGGSVGRAPGIRKAGGTHPTGMLSCFCRMKSQTIAPVPVDAELLRCRNI